MASPYATPSGDVSAAIYNAAIQTGVDPALLFGQFAVESQFNPAAQSKSGAMGLAQIIPSTWDGLAKQLGLTNPYDPNQSALAGATYLKQQLNAFGGNVPLALAAYNAGPGAVKKYNGIPPFSETAAYVPNVLAAQSYYNQSGNLPTLTMPSPNANAIPTDSGTQIVPTTASKTPATDTSADPSVLNPKDDVAALFPMHGDLQFGDYWGLMIAGVVAIIVGFMLLSNGGGGAPKPKVVPVPV